MLVNLPMKRVAYAMLADFYHATSISLLFASWVNLNLPITVNLSDVILQMRCLITLAFMPISDVPSGFEKLVTSSAWPASPQNIAEYFHRNYIGKLKC